MKFLQSLNEYVLKADDTNKYYFLAFDIDKYGSFISLMKNEISPITGISDSEHIINNFLEIRNSLLVMPKEKTKELNWLKKIDYYDEDELCEDNMKLLRRIYDVSDDVDSYPNPYLIRQILTRINKNVKNKKYNSHIVKTMAKRIFKSEKLSKILKAITHIKFPNNSLEFDSFDDLSDKLYNDLLRLEEYDQSDFEYVLKFAIFNLTDVFSVEGEVLVTDKILRIPEKSYLIIKGSRIDDEKLNLLKDKYKLKIINPHFINGFDFTHFKVRGFIKYLDSLPQKFYN
jgi:hypothetical protein